MVITIEKMLRLAKRRVNSKKCPDVEYFDSILSYSNKIIFTKDSAGAVVFEARFKNDVLISVSIKKNGGECSCTFNKVGRLVTSVLKSYDNDSVKEYQSLGDAVYLNHRDNMKRHLLVHYKYDQETKETYVREKIAYDVLRHSTPQNGEVIKYTRGGKISARYVFFNGKKQVYRDVISCEKDKMVISLRNEKMVWVRQ